MTRDPIATHGKTGAVDGLLRLANGEILAFCDIYKFSNAKGETVKTIASYRIELKEMTSRRIPVPVLSILENYAALAEQECPGLIRAFYVVGSVALDGYDEQFSDIDFVAVISHPVSPTDMEALEHLHETVHRKFPKSKLSGSYLQWDDLGKFEEDIQPHPYYQDDRLHATGHFEINSVTWWILKNHGVTMWGPEPKDLPFTVDWDVLLANMRENLNSYWLGWTQQPRAFLVLLSDWGVQWTVLGVLRQYYTFRENSIVTKLDAAKYARNNFPDRWQPLIEEAIHIREGRRKRHYRSRISRMVDTVRFLKYAIQRSNEIFSEQKAASCRRL